MNSRFFTGLVCAGLVLSAGAVGCVDKPTSAPVGEGGTASVSQPTTPNSDMGVSADLLETLTPFPQTAEAHPAPDNTPGVDKAETDLAANPSDPKTSLRLAMSYYKAKAYAQAAPQFVQAARLAPRDATPLLYLGYTQMAVGALSGAQKTFSSVVSLSGVAGKDAAEANLQIGNCLWAVQKNKDAASYFEKALRLNPHEGRASLALGTWAAAQNKAVEAKTLFTNAVRDLPTKRARAQAYACLGRLAEDAKNTSEARTAYQKAAQLDSDNEWAKKALTRLKSG